MRKIQIPWNKGKKGVQVAWNKNKDHPSYKNYIKKVSQPKSQEHKIKIGLVHKGKIVSIETRKKLKEARAKQIITKEMYKKASDTKRRLYAEGKIIKYMLGKKHSQETKKKMSKSRRGKVCSEETKKKLRKPKSEEWKKNISKGLKGHKGLVLDKNPAWLGGKSFEPYTPDFNDKFKEAIRERDNRCCVECNKSEEDEGKRLCVHHIDYNKENSFPQNCVSLCNKCHIHTNINRVHWKKFFQSLLVERNGYEYTEDQKIILDFNEGVLK